VQNLVLWYGKDGKNVYDFNNSPNNVPEFRDGIRYPDLSTKVKERIEISLLNSPYTNA